jgi:hypothetical protein
MAKISLHQREAILGSRSVGKGTIGIPQRTESGREKSIHLQAGHHRIPFLTPNTTCTILSFGTGPF